MRRTFALVGATLAAAALAAAPAAAALEAAPQGEGTGAGPTLDGAATVGQDAAAGESDAPATGAAATEGEGEGEDAAAAADEPGDGATAVPTTEPQRSWWPWVIVGGVAVVGAGVVWGAVATSRRRPPSS